MNIDHFIIIKMFEEEMNNPLKGEMGKQPTKKNQNPYGNAIVNFCVAKYFFQKDHMYQKLFIEDMGLMIVKNHISIQFVESLWMKRLCLKFVSKTCISFQKTIFTRDAPRVGGKN
jgi:hypothetical protein